MKITTSLMLCRIFFITILFMVSTNALMTQIKIKERIEIAPKSNLPLKPLNIQGSTYPVDISVGWDPQILGRLYVDGYDEAFSGSGTFYLNTVTGDCSSLHFLDLQLRVAELMPEDLVHATIIVSVDGNEVLNVNESANGSMGGSAIFCQFIHEFNVVPTVRRFDVTIIPDTVYSYEYANLMAVAIDPRGNEAPLGPVCFINISGEPGDYFLGPSMDTYFNVNNGYVFIGGSDEFDSPVQEFTVTVSGFGGTGTGKLVVKKPPCIVMSISPTKINPGDKAAITLQQLDYMGNLTSFPPDQVFTIWMNTSDQYGKLRATSTGDEGSFIFGQQPFEFVAADSIDVDSMVVDIGASLGGGGVSSIGIGKKDTLRSGALLANMQMKVNNIGDTSNETKRKGFDFTIDQLQKQLKTMNAKNSNEKRKQRLAISIEQLKARLAYDTVKTPTEKHNALARMKQAAMLAADAAVCKPTVEITINKGQECVSVIPVKDTLALGETTLLTFDRGQLFDVYLIGPGQLQSGTITGTILQGVSQPVYYTAPMSIDGNSIDVQFRAVISNGSRSGGNSSKILQKALSQNTIKSPFKEEELNSKIIAILKSQGVLDCLLGKATVRTPELIIYRSDDRTNYFITNEPLMPNNLNIWAFVKNYPQNKDIKYIWKMNVKWVDQFGANWEQAFSRETIIQSPTDVWHVDWKDIFVGGDDITVEAKAVIDGIDYSASPIKDDFNILGLNPVPADAYSGFNDFEKKIMKHESQYQQFYDNGYPKVHCNWSNIYPSADYGIMQVNSSNTVTLGEVWNWEKNKAHGVRIMKYAEGYARSWPASILANKFDNNQNVNATNPIFKSCPDFTTDEELWKETYARYNGNAQIVHYWMWYPPDKNNPDAVSGWLREPNIGSAADYADEVWNVDVP